MSRPPINEAGGRAAVVQAKMSDPEIARLLRLAAMRRKSRSATARELLLFALDQFERAEGVR
jgi:hypothetical protein